MSDETPLCGVRMGGRTGARLRRSVEPVVREFHLGRHLVVLASDATLKVGREVRRGHVGRLFFARRASQLILAQARREGTDRVEDSGAFLGRGKDVGVPEVAEELLREDVGLASTASASPAARSASTSTTGCCSATRHEAVVRGLAGKSSRCRCECNGEVTLHFQTGAC